jgi:toxin YoeB
VKIAFEPAAWEDYEYWRTSDKAMFVRVRRVIAEIVREPYAGNGSPKPLRYTDEMWSRRIDLRHRVVYQVIGDTIELHSLRGHYWYDR